MTIALDTAALSGILRQQIRLAGSERAWALAHSVPLRSVGMFLSGDRPPTDAMLDALGVERQVTYWFKAGSNRNAA